MFGCTKNLYVKNNKKSVISGGCGSNDGRSKCRKGGSDGARWW